MTESLVKALQRLPWPGPYFRDLRPARALIGFAFLAAVAVVAGTALTLWDMRVRELARAEREVANLGRLLTEQTEQAVQGVALLLHSTRDRLQAGLATGYLVEPKALRTLFRARVDTMPQVRTLSLLDEQGQLVVTSRQYPTPALDLGDRAYFATHRANASTGVYVGEVLHSRLDGERTLPMSVRLGTEDGMFGGVVVAGIDLAYFEQLYRTINLGVAGEISLHLRDGTLLASYPRRAEAIGKPRTDGAAFGGVPAALESGRTLVTLRTEADAVPRIVSYGVLREAPLVVSAAVSERAALEGWRQQVLPVSAGAATVVLVLVLLAYVLGRELQRDEALTAALRDSETRLNGIIGSAMDAIITVDGDQRIVLFNPAAEKMFRCSANRALHAPLDRFLPERFRSLHRGKVRRYGEDETVPRDMGNYPDCFGLRADGEEFPADISISQLERGGRKFFTAIVRDVTARRQAEAELRNSHRQLRELSASLQTVREEERARIARELHDELGGHLTGLKMDVSWLGARIGEEQAALADKIGGMKRLIDATVATTRRIATELRPAVLDDLGLAPAVEWLAGDFAKRSGIRVVTDIEDIGPELDNAMATAAFRIAQESLTNVARHAGAGTVHICLRGGDGTLSVEVRDDGSGMPLHAGEKTRSLGLVGMRERAKMFGGQLQIISEPGQGTTVRAVFPLPGAMAGEAPQ